VSLATTLKSIITGRAALFGVLSGAAYRRTQVSESLANFTAALAVTGTLASMRRR